MRQRWVKGENKGDLDGEREAGGKGGKREGGMEYKMNRDI